MGKVILPVEIGKFYPVIIHDSYPLKTGTYKTGGKLGT
jgi:hypothetical protein